MVESDTQLMTADEFWDVYAGQPYELINGIPTRMDHDMTPTGGQHQVVVWLITQHVGQYVLENDAGLVLTGEGGFLLTRDPETIRAFDVAFLRRDRIPEEGIPAGFWPIPPDIAIEVVSPHDRASEVRQKVNEYLDAGISIVWIVYPEQKRVDVYEPGKHVVPLTADDRLTGGEVLAGFEVAVEKLFSRT